MSDGAFITSRCVFDNQIWKDVLKFRTFFYLYGNAVWKQDGKQYGSVKISRGQILRSLRKLQNDLEYIENKAIKKPSLMSVKRTIDKLVNEGRLKIDHTELGTLFTIQNYEDYQRIDNYKKDASWYSDGTVLIQSCDNKKKDKKDKKDILSVPYKEITEIYHNNCPSLPKILRITDNRKKNMNARWSENDSLEFFKDYFARAERSDFLSGRRPNDRNWKCDFDWLINQQNMAKVLEGKYDDQQQQTAQMAKVVYR